VKVEQTLARFPRQSDGRLPRRNVPRDVQDVADKGISLRSRWIWRPAPVISPFPDQSQRCSTKQGRKQGPFVGYVERLARRGSANEEPPVLSVRPQLYTRSVSGNTEERYPAPGGAVNAETSIAG